MGDAAQLFAAFCYVVPGMPMIYTGQLVGNHHRLAFFEKDLIDRDEAYAMGALYQELNALRANNPALQSPEVGAPMERVACDNEAIFACRRVKGNNEVLAVMNMSGEKQNVTLETGETFELDPWSYEIMPSLR